MGESNRGEEGVGGDGGVGADLHGGVEMEFGGFQAHREDNLAGIEHIAAGR